MILISGGKGERRQRFGLPLPKQITKYVNKDAINHLCGGSFRIGSHKYYGAWDKGGGEGNALSTDHHEGSVITTVADANSRIDLPELGLKNIQSYGCGRGITIDEFFDGWLFCATRFGYDPAHHEVMQYGIGDYLGNPENTEYVILDTNLFYPALYRAAAAKYPAVKAIIVGVVRYGEKELLVSANTFAHVVASHPGQALSETFVKPVYFQPENEIRAVFLTDPPFDSLKLSDQYFEVQSNELRAAIVENSLSSTSTV